jgi:hypothetical protein
MKWLVCAEVTKAVQARKEEKMTKARQQLEQLESSLSRQSKARPTADDVEDDDDDEASLDASLEQVLLFYFSRLMPPCTFSA